MIVGFDRPFNFIFHLYQGDLMLQMYESIEMRKTEGRAEKEEV